MNVSEMEIGMDVVVNTNNPYSARLDAGDIVQIELIESRHAIKVTGGWWVDADQLDKWELPKREPKRIEIINECNVDALLRSTQGRWFSIAFVKQDGSYRKITGKLSSCGQKVDFKHPHRIVWDSNPEVFNYRKANLATTMEIVADKCTYRVI